MADEKAVEESEISDKALALAYLDGDNQAVELLFERYRRPFYAYFNRLLNFDRMSADDLFQELWIRILGNLSKCRNLDHFRAWAFTIAHNQVMQHFRSRKARAKIGVVTADGELPEIPGEQAQVTSEMEKREQAELLQQLLSGLSEEQQEVFELRRQGFSFQQIADIQSCPLNTALSRMHYVVGYLKKNFNRSA